MITQTSPFKFLDSYEQKDADIFFGRESETEALYDALSGVKHLLIYGPSGAGKTSLIECGLRNQFSDADWFALSIRRGSNMIASTFARINDALTEKLDLDAQTGMPEEDTYEFGQAIERLFNERFQPVYLLFDQFEELLISGSTKEKEDFFRRLNQLIRYRVPCRVILIMREEFIGHLSEFEPLCPTIFQHRFRLEKMTRSKVKEVIESILDAEYYEDYFEVDEPEQLASSILQKLPDDRKEIDLSHVQVFLSELWDRAIDKGGFERLPLLDLSLIYQEDDLERVLNSFLKKQLFFLAIEYGEKLPLEVLAVMISERFTKLQLDQASLEAELERRKVAFSEKLGSLLEALERRRIIRKIKLGGQTQYEISHDTLALVIGQNLTEDMQLRKKAEDAYTYFLEREGYIPQEDLGTMRTHAQYLPYPKEFEALFEASVAHWKAEDAKELRKTQQQLKKEQELRSVAQSNEKIAEENADRATKRTQIAWVIATIALVSAAIAIWYYFVAQKQTQETKIANDRLTRQNFVSDSLKDVAIQESIQKEREKDRVDSLRIITADRLAELERANAARAQAEDDKNVAEADKREEILKNLDKKIEDIKTMIRVGNQEWAEKIYKQIKDVAPNDPAVVEIGKEIAEMEKKE